MDVDQTELTNPSTYGYDLFRRAIVDRDEDAWAEITVRYRRLLISWAGQCSAKLEIAEYGDDIADQAIARAWRALAPAQFDTFPNLAALLGYLRTCVAAVVIDINRSQAAYERVKHRMDLGPVATPEEVVLGKWMRDELWRHVSALAATPQERTVLIESFALNLPPRAIHERHQELFGDIVDVYNAKRNLLNRLQRNREIQRLRQEVLAV